MSKEYIVNLVLEIEQLKHQLSSLSNARVEADQINDSFMYGDLLGESERIHREIRMLIDRLEKTTTMQERNAVIYPMLKSGEIVPWN